MQCDWNIACLSDLARLSSGKRPSQVEHERSSKIQIPIIGGGGRSGFIDSALCHSPVLVTGRVGTLGKLFESTSPCWPSGNSLVIQPTEKYISFDYAKYALKTQIHHLIGRNRGSANPLITQRDLGELKIQVPSFYEQSKISRTLASLDKA